MECSYRPQLPLACTDANCSWFPMDQFTDLISAIPTGPQISAYPEGQVDSKCNSEPGTIPVKTTPSTCGYLQLLLQTSAACKAGPESLKLALLNAHSITNKLFVLNNFFITRVGIVVRNMCLWRSYARLIVLLYVPQGPLAKGVALLCCIKTAFSLWRYYLVWTVIF